MYFVFFPAPPPAAGQSCLLVPHADRHDRRLLHCLAVNAWLIRTGSNEAM
jgi:hypothetical protein